MKKILHTFVDAGTQEVFCEICGKKEKLKLPLSIEALVKFIEYFNEQHRHCKKKD